MFLRRFVSRYGPCILGLSFISSAIGANLNFASILNTPANGFSSQAVESGSAHLKFVREFSSRDDVIKGLPPILEKSLDIALGPPDPRTLPDKLLKPIGVTTDSAHRVYVTDPFAAVVHVFDFENHKYSFLGGEDSELRSPSGVAVDSQGSVYVTDSVLGVIFVYDAKGKFLKYLGKIRKNEPYFQAPSGIAIDGRRGQIYVCDTTQHLIIVLDKQGHILGHFGKRFGGKRAGEFRYPSRILIAGEEIVVLDSGNYRIQILDLEGHYRREFPVTVLGADTGLALDAQKNIYLNNLRLNTIDVYAYSGKFLYRFGQAGAGPGEFNDPAGMWVDSGDHLYVADTKNARVQVFQIQ